MSYHDVSTWLQQYVHGRPCPANHAQGKVVWLLDSASGSRRFSAVLATHGCVVDGEEPEGLSKLLIHGELGKFVAYLKTGNFDDLACLTFRGDARLWATLLKVAQTKLSPFAVRINNNFPTRTFS